MNFYDFQDESGFIHLDLCRIELSSEIVRDAVKNRKVLILYLYDEEEKRPYIPFCVEATGPIHFDDETCMNCEVNLIGLGSEDATLFRGGADTWSIIWRPSYSGPPLWEVL